MDQTTTLRCIFTLLLKLCILLTGEILIPSVTKTSASPSVKKSSSFTSSIEIVLSSPRSPVTSTDSGDGKEMSVTDSVKRTLDCLDNSEDNNFEDALPQITPEEPKITPEVPQATDTVVLRNKPGKSPTLLSKHRGKSKSVCEASPLKEKPGGLDSRHKKSLSDPIKKSDEKRGRRKLLEYQKWQKFGRRGKPPGDLKISE